MALDEFIAEVMQILRTEREVKEVCVKRVHPLRFAAEAGQEPIREVLRAVNERMRKVGPAARAA